MSCTTADEPAKELLENLYHHHHHQSLYTRHAQAVCRKHSNGKFPVQHAHLIRRLLDFPVAKAAVCGLPTATTRTSETFWPFMLFISSILSSFSIRLTRIRGACRALEPRDARSIAPSSGSARRRWQSIAAGSLDPGPQKAPKRGLRLKGTE